jgi:hypothetical protein
LASWFDIRQQARRDIHAAFSVSASYRDTTMPAPIDVSVRWQDRFTTGVGDISGGDYARVFDNIDKIIFDIDELAAKGITPRQGATVTLLDYGVILVLDSREPYNGPVTLVWTVERRR